MRTLTNSALRDKSEINVPRQWLESIKYKAASYAKNQSIFVTEHKLCEIDINSTLTVREHDILRDLYHGFSQSEIARKHSLSLNSVKMATKSIYEKLNVHKISDLVRVAAEHSLV
jgi:DNA-binding NarL/FixJ family response regulator